MTDWQIAMACLIPLMFGGAKWRVWLVLLASSLAGNLWWHPGWFTVVALIAAAFTLYPPKVLGQRVIGGIYGAMALFDIGYLLSPQQGSEMYVAALIALGWAQWFTLLCWGLHDAWFYYLRGAGPSRSVCGTPVGRVR